MERDNIVALVTFETVAKAAEILQTTGQRASVRNVIASLGGGSPNAVLAYLGEWKAGRPLVRAADTALNLQITTAITAQMQRVASEAAAAEDRAAAVAGDLQTLSEAHRQGEQQIEALTAARDAAQALGGDLMKQLEDARADAEHQQQAAALRDEVAAERLRYEQAASTLAKAEVRLEALPLLQSEIVNLRAALADEQKKRQQAEQMSVVTGTQLAEAALRATDAAETIQKYMKNVDALTQSLEKSRETARIAGEQAAELRGRLAVLLEPPKKTKVAKKAGNPVPTDDAQIT
jgi:DNA repair exonuclease SbcCD ATPase subunit